MLLDIIGFHKLRTGVQINLKDELERSYKIQQLASILLFCNEFHNFPLLIHTTHEHYEHMEIVLRAILVSKRFEKVTSVFLCLSLCSHSIWLTQLDRQVS